MSISCNQKRLLGRLLFLLILYSFLRIGFYFYHLQFYKQFNLVEIFYSFLLGIRFDIAAICLLNAPVIVVSLLPRISEKFVRVLFIGMNTVGFIATLIDYELFLFVGKKLSLDFFVITEDILDQLPQLALYYWYLPMAAIILACTFYFLDKKIFARNCNESMRLGRELVGSALILGLTFVGIRGGLQHKSINVQSAFIQGKNELGHLVINTPYHFIRTLKNQRVEKLAWVHDEKRLILNHREFGGDYAGRPKANIVLIILESFGLEYVERGYTPFLSELRKKSLYFEKHLANGRRSIESLPSLLCGLPQLIEEPISKSSFSGNKFTCMPKMLEQQGYTNYFFHAGARGTMGFESYTLANGFNRYFSKEDYPDQKDFDGHWGIYDGPFFHFIAREMDSLKEPFLVGVFTLSSHQPYAIPENLKGKFPKGPLEIHESIGYTDHALKDFFDSVEHKPWFKNTLFIITADHTQKHETKKYHNILGAYRVPLLLYAPGHEWGKVNTKKVTQHADIPETVLDFVEVKYDGMPATGRSIFSADRGLAINFAEGRTYFLVQDEKVLEMDKGGPQKSYVYDWETGESGPAEESHDPLLKAYLQYFINGLITNNLSLYR